MDSRFGTDFSDRKILEKYSSAFTLSDMEIFIFPELFYPLGSGKYNVSGYVDMER